MDITNEAATVDDPAAGRGAGAHRFRALAGTGVLGALAAMASTTLVAAAAQGVGVTFEVPAGGEAIPLPGFAVVTGVFCTVGTLVAAAFLRWGARPAERFVRTASALTAASLVPPLLVGAAAPTVVALLGLHLVAAAVMIPALTRGLRRYWMPHHDR